jgi:hypothetical protein
LQYSYWFITSQMQDTAFDLLMASFHETLVSSPDYLTIENLYNEEQISYIQEASQALKALLYRDPTAFTETNKLSQIMGKLNELLFEFVPAIVSLTFVIND